METVVLTGPKHVGKSQTGAALAELLRVPFIDLDSRIESRTGKSPRTLYREGPDVFRNAETEALRSLIETIDAEKYGKRSIREVVAAGGGIVDNEAASALLQQEGILVVSIEVPVETAWERIRAEAERTGELPAFLNTENPQETHAALHRRRAAAARKLAGFTVSGAGTPQAIAWEIARAINKR
ncbi:MAG: shikimate kinase [Treponema sp.]|jgi:shikimate kinase|nr:shikimate kinase [Treponema sp.]